MLNQLISIHELKEQLHQKIDQLNDEKILSAINTLIHTNEVVFVIPDEWKEGIQQGSEDIESGRFYTIKDFEKKYEKWLEG